MSPAPRTTDTTLLEPVQQLATLLRVGGVDVSTSDVIDASRALTVIDVGERELVRACLRAVMVSRETHLVVFERAFEQVFSSRRAGVGGESPDPSDASDPADGSACELEETAAPAGPPDAARLRSEVATAATSGDAAAMAELAARAVDALGGDLEGRVAIHRIMRAIDLSNMLSAAMRTLRRDGELSAFELALKRHEIAAALEAFRRALAAEIDRRRVTNGGSVASGLPADVADRPVLELSTSELRELRRALYPLARQLAARVGRRRRSRTTGRLDLRRTVRRSLQSGGIPFDPALRRRHPHRPDVVVLCDVSGSVAEFARFTFMLTHAIHDVLAGVRSFAFVGGVAEMTEVFATAHHEVPVQRILEGRAESGRVGDVVGLDGHSDYGAVFRQFVARHLDDAVGSRTTVIVTGDGRSNFRDPGVDAFAVIAERARRVYWLDPEPRAEWSTDDSAMDSYAPLCDGVFEVATVRALSDVIADLV